MEIFDGKFSEIKPSLHKQIQIYLDNYYDPQYLEDAKKLHKQFLETFPRENIKNMTVNQYALGITDRGSFSWWLEYNTNNLGSIKGGSAGKHLIFYSKKEDRWRYPAQFASVEEAWIALRADIQALLDAYEGDMQEGISADNLLYRANMLKGKILYLYHPDKFLPIYSQNHLKELLQKIGVPKKSLKGLDSIALNLMLLSELKQREDFTGWSNHQIADFLYEIYMKENKYYKIAPGKDAMYWEQCLEGGFISMGWDEVGDLTRYSDYNELTNAFKANYPSENQNMANEVWQFFNLKEGDQVVANKGISHILAIGTVNGKGYEFREDLQAHKHVVYVDWHKVFEPALKIPEEKAWATQTLSEVPETKVQDWMKGEQEAVSAPEKTPEIIFTTKELAFFTKLDKALERKGQVILYGPPGTGKTYQAKRYVAWKNQQAQYQGGNLEMCTFHPSFQYEDFMEGFKPQAAANGMVTFQLEEGIFVKMARRAAEEPDHSYYFIIDELNRGNVPKIFGEIITLLEKDKRGDEVILPQSKQRFSIPENLFIIATMNTSDRSIKMMDAALKRRFSFIECMPEYHLIDDPVDNLSITPATILQKVNEKLVALQGRDKQIGHAYFMKGGEQVTSIEDMRHIFALDLLPLIQEYCFDDYQQLADIVGDGFVDVEQMAIRTELFEGAIDAFIQEIEGHFK